jgi:hypothetical protein
MEKKKDIMKGQHVYSPNYHIMLEPVYGCNRRCSFCACDFTQMHLMNEEVFGAILDNITEETKRMTWNLCGESTLHPKLIEMVRMAKKKAPKAAFDIITNGDVKVTRKRSLEYFEALIDAGMNLIHYDVYDTEDIPIVKEMLASYTGNKFEVRAFEDGEGSFWGQNGKKPVIVWMPAQFNVNRPNKVHIRFNTQAGCTPYNTWKENGVDGKKFPLRKTCKEVLKYSVIGWDGKYILCCADHGRPTDYGNILTLSIKDYWESRKRRMVQLALDAGRRDLVPSCYYCDKLSFRDGLYPYPYTDSMSVSTIRDELFGASKLEGKMLNNFTQIKDAIGFASLAVEELYNKSVKE